MKVVVFLTCVVFISLARYTNALEEYKKINSCSCKNSTYIIDLSSIAFHNKTARFIIRPKNYVIYWNPCYSITVPVEPPKTGQCTDVAICYLNGTKYDNIGDQTSVTFIHHPVTTLPTIKYKRRAPNTDENPSNLDPTIARVMLDCSPNYPGSLTFLGEFRPGEFDFGYKGLAACGYLIPDSGMSPGTVLIIVLFVCLSVYLIAGVSYQRFAMNKRGWGLLPNRDVWRSLVSHIQHGLLFVVTCGKDVTPPIRGEQYEKM